jgi:hypothetical protein
MNTTHYLVYIEARQLLTEARLSAAEILVEVSPEPVKSLIEKAGEDAASLDEARQRRFSSKVAEDAVLDFARTEIPVTSQDCYYYKVDPVSNPHLITSRVTPTASAGGCRLWLLKKQR